MKKSIVTTLLFGLFLFSSCCTKKVIDDYPVWTDESIKHRFNWLVEQTKTIFEIE